MFREIYIIAIALIVALVLYASPAFALNQYELEAQASESKEVIPFDPKKSKLMFPVILPDTFVRVYITTEGTGAYVQEIETDYGYYTRMVLTPEALTDFWRALEVVSHEATHVAERYLERKHGACLVNLGEHGELAYIVDDVTVQVMRGLFGKK